MLKLPAIPDAMTRLLWLVSHRLFAIVSMLVRRFSRRLSLFVLGCFVGSFSVLKFSFSSCCVVRCGCPSAAAMALAVCWFMFLRPILISTPGS